MTIDMHSHWHPPALIDALRARKVPPHIVTNDDGEEVLRSNRGDMPLDKAFDNVESRLADMDTHGVTTAVLSLFGMFQWIERLPVEESLPLVQLFNDSTSQICQDNPERFAVYASLPLADLDAAAAEFRRAIDLPGVVGAILPGNAFLTYEDAQAYAPIMEVANEKRAVIFVHWNPLPGDTWPRVNMAGDNAIRRLGTLDMQASLSSNMVTLCMTDFLDAYPDARVHIHNLGGNIPFEIERMDHRNFMDTPDQPLPSSLLRKPNLYVDLNSFGARAIELGIEVYGADRIMYATDGTAFGCDWTNKALAEANISPAELEMIRYGNAAGILGHLVDLPEQRQAAE